MTGRHSGAKTINNGFWGWLFVPVLLAGCLEDTNSTQSPGFATGGVSTATSWNADSPRTKVASDEELAPNVFSVQDDGIWDGRPSLGGVWVSHEDATTPERVLVTDPATGKSVVAALFRRLPGQAGPSVRVSSEAAGILGMTPGAPTTLDVVALKRTGAAAAPEAAEATADGTTPPASSPADTENSVAETASAAATAIAASPSSEPQQTPAPETAAPANASDANVPFVQIGLFSVEENARSAATQLADTGLPVQVDKVTSGSASFWRLRVGPLATQQAVTKALADIKAMGFSDAYATR
ncbi:MAG: SPOR domain-containing protein [Rhodobacteraceae bacterium]|nr:SPOR domain-containing protein [Paracoccaceae bacterium]